MDMTEGVIWKQLLLFSLPLLAGNLFQQFYNTVDSVVVGNFVGPEALASVTSNMPAMNTLIGMFIGFATGASVLISQYFGAKNDLLLRRSIHTAVLATLFLSFVMAGLGVFLAPHLVRFMRTPPTVAEGAVTYLRIYFAGVSGLMLYNMGSAVLRAVGDSKRPLMFLIICSLVNVALDLLFVVRFRMGVAGVAYATVIAQFISTIATFFVLFRSTEVYGMTLRELSIDPAILKRITLLGLPAGLQMAVTSFSNVFVQSYINSFGAASTAGWGAYLRIDAFTVLPVMSIGLAVTTFVGQNAGARNYDRIRQCLRTGMIISVSITAVLAATLFTLAPHVIALFNRDPGVLYFGTLFLRMIGPLDFLVCTNQIYSGMLRGIGDTRAPMVIMLFSFVVFRQIYLFTASHITSSIYPVALGYPVGWLVCNILLVAYTRRCGWEERLKNG